MSKAKSRSDWNRARQTQEPTWAGATVLEQQGGNESVKTKRFHLNVIWQPGSAREPTQSFVQSESGEWCKADEVAKLELALRRFESPGFLRATWHRLFGRGERP